MHSGNISEEEEEEYGAGVHKIDRQMIRISEVHSQKMEQKEIGYAEAP